MKTYITPQTTTIKLSTAEHILYVSVQSNGINLNISKRGDRVVSSSSDIWTREKGGASGLWEEMK